MKQKDPKIRADHGDDREVLSKLQNRMIDANSDLSKAKEAGQSHIDKFKASSPLQDRN